MVWRRNSAIVVIRLLVSFSVIFGFLLLTAQPVLAAARPYVADYTLRRTDVVEPDEVKTYHVDVELADRLFTKSNKWMGFDVKVIGNGSVQVFFLRGHTDSPAGFIEEHSSYQNTTRFTSVYWFGEDDGEKFTVLVKTEEDFNVSYEILIKTFKEESSYWNVVLGGVILLGIIAFVVFFVWRQRMFTEEDPELHPFKHAPKTGVRHSPERAKQFQEMQSRFGQSRIRSLPGKTPQGPLRIKESKTSQSNCPYCKKALGVKENRLRFKNIKFVEKRSPEKEGEMGRPVIWKMRAHYCEGCGSVIEISKRRTSQD